MSRYIEADAYRAKWADIFDSAYGDSCCEMFKKSIDEQPIADVVEVVRCKDCTRQFICYHSDDYYCADGERRDDAEKTD